MTPQEHDADKAFWSGQEWLEDFRFRIVDEGLGHGCDCRATTGEEHDDDGYTDLGGEG